MINLKGKIGLFIPTFNAGRLWEDVIKSIAIQTVKPDRKLIIDSGSEDKTRELAEENGFLVIQISSSEFNHGSTRNQAIDILSDCDFIIYLTQDVILADEYSFLRLIQPFDDEDVACVYGRQLPHKDANPLAIHARQYNYPEKSMIKEKSMIPKIGFKVSHISNAFCAYRASLLVSSGRFPVDVIIAEDTYLASTLIKNDHKIVYKADATVYHSHNYSIFEEFRRYFDTGVFHAQNDWIRKDFGQPNGEGKKYIFKELNYIINNNPKWIFTAIASNFMKFLGFTLGKRYRRFPNKLLRHLSMHKNYWK